MTADKPQAEPGKSLVSGKSGKSAFSVHAEKLFIPQVNNFGDYGKGVFHGFPGDMNI